MIYRDGAYAAADYTQATMHITLSLIAHAFLSVIRAREAKIGALQEVS
jgi:hypothetical protein